MKRLYYLLLLVCSVLTGCAAEQRLQEARFPMKIGLLADSQITSKNGFSDFSFRSKLADNIVDVSIRPPALERYLAEEMLNIALKKLTQDANGEKEGVDVILYLGDGANSGGTDEIETLFTALKKHRDETGTPIFMLIGNHDYLGAGNIVSPGTRFALLNREGQPSNPALSKYQVLKKISKFNNTSNSMPTNKNFRYIDNFAMVERNKHLDHRTGLYLSGRIGYSEYGKDGVEIFLVDSSDYKDAPDWSRAAEWGFYGVVGSVSYKDEPDGNFLSQLSYFKKLAESSAPDFRFMASHYPKDHLDRITFAQPGEVPLNLTNMTWDVVEGTFNFPVFAETLNKNLKNLLSPSRRNYWLSAHTHVPTMPRPEKINVGGILGDVSFDAINIGSTTDYRAHVAIVERFESYHNNRIDGFVGFREIPLFDCNEDLLETIPRAIAEYGREHYGDPNFQCFMQGMIEGTEPRDWKDIGASILGLNKKYQEDCWGEKQNEASERHLRKFVTDFVESTESNRADVIAFLGLIAGAYEEEKIPDDCDFSLSYLKKLCNGQ